MRRIQSVLPFGNAQPLATMTLGEMTVRGFWFCRACNSTTERIEGEQGRPAHCGRCLSPLTPNDWHKPELEAA